MPPCIQYDEKINAGEMLKDIHKLSNFKTRFGWDVKTYKVANCAVYGLVDLTITYNLPKRFSPSGYIYSTTVSIPIALDDKRPSASAIKQYNKDLHNVESLHKGGDFDIIEQEQRIITFIDLIHPDEFSVYAGDLSRTVLYRKNVAGSRDSAYLRMWKEKDKWQLSSVALPYYKAINIFPEVKQISDIIQKETPEKMSCLLHAFGAKIDMGRYYKLANNSTVYDGISDEAQERGWSLEMTKMSREECPAVFYLRIPDDGHKYFFDIIEEPMLGYQKILTSDWDIYFWILHDLNIDYSKLNDIRNTKQSNSENIMEVEYKSKFLFIPLLKKERVVLDPYNGKVINT